MVSILQVRSKVQSKKFILGLISSAIFIWSNNSNALTWGQIFSGAGTVGNSWNEEERRQLEKRRMELEVEKMNREAEIQKLDYQKKMQQLQQGNFKGKYDLHGLQRDLNSKLPMAVDNDTVLMSASALNTYVFQFSYKLINHAVSDLNIGQFQNDLKAKVHYSVCTNSYWGDFVRSGGHVIYHYTDKANNFLSSVQISSC